MAKVCQAQISAPLVVVLALVASTAVLSARTHISSRDLEILKANSTEEFLPLLLLIPIIVASVGVGGTAAAVAGVTLMDYLNSTDAPQEFSYIRLPQAEACKADPTSIGTFFSKATNRSSDPRKCSICRSITATLSEMEDSSSWFSWGPDLELVNASCSKLSPAMPELQSECRDLATSLLSEVPQLHQKVLLLANATELRGRFAAHASCEDLQCCPQDPFVAEVVAGVAIENLQRPADVNIVEQIGVVGGILGSQDARTHLEEHLTYLTLVRDTVRNETFSAPHLIKDDKQCTWDYVNAQCKNPDVCHYDFHLGDLMVDDSCRLKPSVKAPPKTDAGCEWDYSVNMCHKSEFCSRQCKADDASLSDCCRLREPVSNEETCGPYCASTGCEWTSVWSCPWAPSNGTAGRADDDGSTGYYCCCEVQWSVLAMGSTVGRDGVPCGAFEEMDGSKVEEGNCDTQEDRALMLEPSTPARLETISKGSFNIWRMQINASQAFRETADIGFSKRCASCFVDLFVCGTHHCYTELAEEKDGVASSAAKSCLADHCGPDLVSCAGVGAVGLPLRP